jgi:hypothetical protein
LSPKTCSALVVASLLSGALGAGCDKPGEAPSGARRVAEAFERAVLAADCERAWGLLTESRRLQSDHHDFCKRLPLKCVSGEVSLQSAQSSGPKVEVEGFRQCGGRRGISFWVELSPQDGGWAISAFTEG